jgi:hypothetical protein
MLGRTISSVKTMKLRLRKKTKWVGWLAQSVRKFQRHLTANLVYVAFVELVLTNMGMKDVGRF